MKNLVPVIAAWALICSIVRAEESPCVCCVYDGEKSCQDLYGDRITSPGCPGRDCIADGTEMICEGWSVVVKKSPTLQSIWDDKVNQIREALVGETGLDHTLQVSTICDTITPCQRPCIFDVYEEDPTKAYSCALSTNAYPRKITTWGLNGSSCPGTLELS